MQQIEITCFASGQECQFTSPSTRMLVEQPSDVVWQVLLHNRSDQTCALTLSLLTQQADAHSFSLQVSDNQHLLYQGAWSTALEMPIHSSLAAYATQTLTYHFDFDAGASVQAIFDLDIAFACTDAPVATSSIAPVASTPITTTLIATPSVSQAAVLGSQTRTANSGDLWLFLWSFLLLCALGFFVIMNFIHAKKKARSRQHSLAQKVTP